MAALLARTRSDEEVYLLIAIFSIRGKSRMMRTFHRKSLDEVSLRLAMKSAAVNVDKTLRKLVKDGYLRGGGPVGKYTTTDAGNCVKHQFHRSRADCETDGVPPSISRSIGFVSELRREVLRRCEDQNPIAARSIEGRGSAIGGRDEE